MSEIVHEAQTIEAKHIFIDIVKYTHGRCVEAQSDLIEILNTIVKESVKELGIDDSKDIIYSSTGDGMCITLKNVIDPYDIHMQIALLLLEKKAEHNKKETRKMRIFDIRIGINENTDNLITDINKQEAVSGAGINEASRLEGLCDKSQIIVGKSVHSKLEQRELYMGFFKEYFAIVKHGKSLPVYQYIDESKSYLNNNIPEQLKKKEIEQKKIVISELQAFYMINCIKYRDFIVKNIKEPSSTYVLAIIFFHLAEDELAKRQENEMSRTNRKKVDKSYIDYYEELYNYSFWITADFASLIKDSKLKNIQNYFENTDYLSVNKKGKKELMFTYPDLCKEYDINI